MSFERGEVQPKKQVENSDLLKSALPATLGIFLSDETATKYTGVKARRSGRLEKLAEEALLKTEKKDMTEVPATQEEQLEEGIAILADISLQDTENKNLTIDKDPEILMRGVEERRGEREIVATSLMDVEGLAGKSKALEKIRKLRELRQKAQELRDKSLGRKEQTEPEEIQE